MQQHFDRYTRDDHEVWGILFDRQVENLQTRACTDYLTCLNEMEGVLDGRAIPDFQGLDEALLTKTGWSIEVVPGLIPVEEFFELLSKRRFCSSTWIRQKSQLDYLEEPDMFHDIFGHVPLLMDPEYADFMEAFGRAGMQFMGDSDAIMKLRRLYWFTIEFGLMKEAEQLKIYGAGIISSFGEAREVYETQIDRRAFDIQTILDTDFRTDVMQSIYYVAKSLDQVYTCLNPAIEILESRNLVVQESV
ncbi:MAG: phenylalanine 4-monooxygenase [Bacteroidota bacterium]